MAVSRAGLQRQIREEAARRRSYRKEEILGRALNGGCQEALTDLVFFTDPSEVGALIEGLLGEIVAQFPSAPQGLQEQAMLFVADLTKWLRSYLPHWNLTDEVRWGARTCSEEEVRHMADRAHQTTARLAGLSPQAEQTLLNAWHAETARRFRAEGVKEPEAEADASIGASLDTYLSRFCTAISQSNLRRIAEMRAQGKNETEVSNDNAAFLGYALYLGASFVTCNPPLVDMAWTSAPAEWNPVVDELIRTHPAETSDGLARLVTLEVVLSNMRLLRPIFLLTSGGMGCVCLQVNPHHHGDEKAMIADAHFYYEELRRRVEGVPNVVFKLPGTLAGWKACRVLTREGIGVTITVNFAMFQHIPFAEAIRDGKALFSTLVTMSGRLSYPVRDELLAKLGELEAHGIGEKQARVAAAWAGVAVLKRLQALLGERGYDLNRIKPLTASHRVYDGEGYADLPNPLLDVTEVIGTRIITVFPNIRRALDSLAPLPLNPRQIDRPVPAEVLSVLAHSEIFKQAYFVGDRRWLKVEDRRLIPEKPLCLEEEEAVAAWTPVRNTLAEFCQRYDQFLDRIEGRRHLSTLR
jgi:transaldolase